jgi:hypothetical protein
LSPFLGREQVCLALEGEIQIPEAQNVGWLLVLFTPDVSYVTFRTHCGGERERQREREREKKRKRERGREIDR